MKNNFMEKTNKNNIPFPECAKNCDLVEYFGVGECEDFCPDKFDEYGNIIKENNNPKDTHENKKQTL